MSDVFIARVQSLDELMVGDLVSFFIPAFLNNENTVTLDIDHIDHKLFTVVTTNPLSLRSSPDNPWAQNLVMYENEIAETLQRGNLLYKIFPTSKDEMENIDS